MSTDNIVLAQVVYASNQAQQWALLAQQYAQQTADKAPLDSPAFVGLPTAPTQPDLSNNELLATTAYLDRLRGQPSGVATLDNTGKIPSSQIPPFQVTAVYVVGSEAAMLALTAGAGAFAIRTDQSNAVYILTQTPASTLANWTQIGTAPVLSVAGLTGAISVSDLMTALGAAALNSPALTGTPTAPTVAGTVDSTTKIATTAFVQAVAALLATKASPALTGTPTAPTAELDTNTGQIANCAFVLGQGSAVGDGTPAMDGTAARGVSTHWARADHVHPTDTSRAPIASPAFTGTPQAPTPSVGDNSNNIATTAFVQTAASGSFTTGDVKMTLKTAADTGWLMMNDGTIGSAASGAGYANAAAQNLFNLLYNNITDTWCPLLTSVGGATTRGAQGSAAAAWAANCRMSLPKMLGRAIAIAGTGGSLSSRALAQYLGEETHTLTAAEQASMNFSGATGTLMTANIGTSDGNPPYPAAQNSTMGGNQATNAVTSVSGTAVGGGGAHNNMQPTSFLNVMIKL